MNGIERANRLADVRERIVEAARSWYRNGGNAEAELAARVQELESLLMPQGAQAR